MGISPTKKLLQLMSDTTALAKIDSAALADKVNSAVTKAFKFAEQMSLEVDAARKLRTEMAQVLARPEDCDDPKVRAEVKAKFDKADERIATAIAKRDEAIADFNQYMDEQAKFFRSKGQDPMRRYKEMIIPRGEVTLPSGRTVNMMVIVKRNRDFTPVDTEENEHALSVAASHADSERVGIARDQHRGKYNDGHMLINQEAANIDRSEYANWNMM